MAAKKANQTIRKESKFYTVKMVNEAREKIESKVNTYNEKYVKKTVENGREFISELKANPVQRIDDLIDDSKDAFKKARVGRMETLQRKVDATQKDVRKKIELVIQKTQKVYKGIENDGKLIVEDIVALGKKNLEKIPMKKAIEKRISAGINSIPGKLNLPSKEEIDHLVAGINGANEKVDALNKQYVNA